MMCHFYCRHDFVCAAQLPALVQVRLEALSAPRIAHPPTLWRRPAGGHARQRGLPGPHGALLCAGGGRAGITAAWPAALWPRHKLGAQHQCNSACVQPAGLPQCVRQKKACAIMAFLVCFCFCLQPLEEKMADVRPELAYQVGRLLGVATVCRSSRCRSCSPA